MSSLLKVQSINRLVDIANHAVFGAYLKTVVMCSARRTVTPKTSQFHPLVDEADGSNYINAYVKTKRFARQMGRVFANIKSRSGSATIGIYDNPGEGDLSQIFETVGSKHMPCFGWAQLVDQSSTYIAYRTEETFEQTVFAARRARCPIKCLKMELFSLHQDSLSSNLDKAIQRVLESSPATGTPLSLDLGGSRTSHLLYYSESRRVELDSVFLHYDQLSGGIGVPLNGVHAWLTTQRINRLKVSRIDSYILSALQAYFTPHLSSLEFSLRCEVHGAEEIDAPKKLLLTLRSIVAMQKAELRRVTRS